MKIMKKVLALLLALAILSVPMVANAATGDAVPVPSYQYCIYSGDTATVPAGETIFFEISTDGLADTFPFTVTGGGDFTVAVCTEDGSGAYIEGSSVAAVDGKVETTIAGYESTSYYGCFGITNNSDEEVSYVCTIEFPVGTQGNPHTVTLTLDSTATVTIPAGAQHYIAATLPQMQVDYLLTISGNTGFGIPSMWGMPTWDTNGTITVTANAYYAAYSLSLINNTTEEQTYTLSLAEMPIGTESKPDDLYIGETSKELDNKEYYYTWTAYEAGTFKFAIDTEACKNGWTYKLTRGDVVNHFSTAWDEDDKNVCYVNVAPDDVITIGISIPTYNSDYDYYDAYTPASGTIAFTTAFGKKGDVNCDGGLAADDLTMFRKELISAIDNDWYVPGAYDVNEDGSFDILDFVRTKKLIAGIFNVGDAVAVPSYEYCIYSGDSITVPAGKAVVYEISTNFIYDVLPLTVSGTGNYTVAVCTEDGEGAYLAGAPVTAVDGVVSTNIQGYESTNGYACFIIKNDSDADVTYTCTIEFPVGSQSNPEAVTLYVDEPVSVTVPAGGQYYIAATLPQMQVDYMLTVSGNTGFGISSGMGMPTWDTDGAITVTANAYFGAYNFSIVNTTDSEQTYTLSLANMPLGSESNPDELTMNNTYTLELVNKDYNYTWTAPYKGNVTFTIDNELSTNGWTYKVTHGDMAYHFSTGWDESEKNICAFDVEAGDVVTIGVSVPTYYEVIDSYDPYTPATGTVVFTADYNIVLEEGDAVAVPSYEYCIYSGDSITVPAGKTLVYEISTNYNYDVLPFTVSGTGDYTVAICTADGNGAYVAGAPVAAVDGVVTTDIQGFESTYGYGCFIITNNSDTDITYSCNIEFPVGTQSNPEAVTLVVDGIATVTVPAGTQYYIAATLPEMQKDYLLTISGNTGFGIPAGMGMPTWDTNGVITVTANAFYSAYNFSVINNTDEEQTYTLSLANMPLGAESNPDALTLGTTTKALENNEYYYTWTATEAGTFEFVIDNELCANGWTYKLTAGDTVYHFSTGWGESDKNVQTLTLAAGDVVTLGVSVPTYYESIDAYEPYQPSIGTVVFTTTFTAE